MADRYTMQISRLTVDKLGVKLYDRVSAVITELIANAYDADATEALIRAPMGHYLVRKQKRGGEIIDKGSFISVEDDGHGMTPEEMQNFYLVVGAERRSDERGSVSKRFNRKVMGRKGVGKLAPFGICRTIEIISAGGEEISGNGDKGFHTSHVILDYDDIVSDRENTTEPYVPGIGDKDDSLSPKPGTCVKLQNFNYRLVPGLEDLSRQIAQRFGIETGDWSIKLIDNEKERVTSPHTVGRFDLQHMPDTRIELKKNSVIGPDGSTIPGITSGFSYEGVPYELEGWMAYSKQPYRDELMAGVRIYCRGKIAAQTRLFNLKAGFTGEHNIRSYLIGELHADWLDEKEDLIQTDRRDILWSDPLTSEFEKWGQKIVKKIGTMSRDPMRKTTAEIFKTTSNVDARARERYPGDAESAIRDSAVELAAFFGKTMRRQEAEDEEVVKEYVDLSLDLAPHVVLDNKMREAAEQSETTIDILISILRTAKIAELASYGRIAKDRIKVMERLETLKDNPGETEDGFQRLIEDAPWLINPAWAPVTANQKLSTLRKEFEKHLNKNIKDDGQEVNLTQFEDPDRRPDFVLTEQEGMVHVVEIKRPGHKLTNEEMERIDHYRRQLQEFLGAPGNEQLAKSLNGVHTTVVCDKLGLTGTADTAFKGLVRNKELTHVSWTSFLSRARQANQDFLDEADRRRGLMK